MPKLRDYQQEDVDAVLRAHETHRVVIGRAATGLGKAVELAALAAHYQSHGRVMVLVDVVKLVDQLAETIHWFTGMPPGVEMGDRRANNGGFLNAADAVVCSTVQTQYSGPEGQERYRQFDPREFAALLLDECELFLAPKAMEVVRWYLDRNPALKVYGCTATPFRTDGTAMAELFEHAAFDRDILWGMENGWLVPARQAFVRVNIDFSTLKIRKGEDGERDYSDAEIAERIANEQTLIELAKGIIHVAGTRRSIVVAPDVATAKAIAHYLCGEREGCAKSVYGELGDQEKVDVMAGHRNGDFQFLTSVMMLTKGYDDPEVAAIFNCRKTRSKRLYTQILGRGTRPLKGLLEELATPEERRAAIAASAKPDMLMVNMVGVDRSVRDITVVDILGEKMGDAAVERAKQRMLEADDEETFDPEEEATRAKEEQDAEEQRLREEEEARQRRRVEVKAEVEVEYSDDLTVGGGQGAHSHIPPQQLRILRRGKLKEHEIARLSAEAAKELSREIVRRWKSGLCSYRQAKCLQKYGYSRDELHDMSKVDAKAAIDAIAANGWRRPPMDQQMVEVEI